MKAFGAGDGDDDDKVANYSKDNENETNDDEKDARILRDVFTNVIFYHNCGGVVTPIIVICTWICHHCGDSIQWK